MVSSNGTLNRYALYQKAVQNPGAEVSNGKLRPCLSRNFAWLFASSGEIPYTLMRRRFSSAQLSRIEQASLVQPGVSSLG